jgi:hypothetical protein
MSDYSSGLLAGGLFGLLVGSQLMFWIWSQDRKFWREAYERMSAISDGWQDIAIEYAEAAGDIEVVDGKPRKPYPLPATGGRDE